MQSFLADAVIVRWFCSGTSGADVELLVDAYGVCWIRVKAFSGPRDIIGTDCETSCFSQGQQKTPAAPSNSGITRTTSTTIYIRTL